MAFGSIAGSIGKIVSHAPITKVVNPSIFTPKLTTGLIPSSGNPLSALVGTTNLQNLTPSQIALVLGKFGKK